MHESQKASKQVQQVVKKTNCILAFIAKRLEFKNREVLLQLFRVLVRPHLEYCGQFWSPFLKKDLVTLEAVQGGFIRLIPGMRGLSYQERLNSLGLYSLEFRRVRGDLIQTYQILRELDRVDGEMFSLVGESQTRAHNYKIKGQSFKTEVRRNLFSQRVVNLWILCPKGPRRLDH